MRTEGDPKEIGWGQDRSPPSCPSQHYLRWRKQRRERSGPGPCSLPLLFLQGQRRLPVTPRGQSHSAASLVPPTASSDAPKPPTGPGQVPAWLVALCRFSLTLSPRGLLVRRLQMKLTPQEDLSRNTSLSRALGFRPLTQPVAPQLSARHLQRLQRL